MSYGLTKISCDWCYDFSNLLKIILFKWFKIKGLILEHKTE